MWVKKKMPQRDASAQTQDYSIKGDVSPVKKVGETLLHFCSFECEENKLKERRSQFPGPRFFFRY